MQHSCKSSRQSHVLLCLQSASHSVALLQCVVSYQIHVLFNSVRDEGLKNVSQPTSKGPALVLAVCKRRISWLHSLQACSKRMERINLTDEKQGNVFSTIKERGRNRSVCSDCVLELGPFQRWPYMKHAIIIIIIIITDLLRRCWTGAQQRLTKYA